MESKRPTAVDSVVRFLKEHSFDKAEWSTDLICYSKGKKRTRHEAETSGLYDLKCHWYDLELFLEKEIGMYNPERPKVFFKEKPVKKK